MRRVLVMGCSGSGKSTFAMALSAKLGLPFVSLDSLFWKPGCVESSAEEFGPKVAAAAAGDAWVIDGNFTRDGAGELRRARADTVFWFDLPRWTCLAGVVRRIAASHGRVRPEMAPGCPERFDPDFLRYVWRFRATQRPKLLAYLADLRPDQRLVTFRRRRQAAAFLAGVR